ncbi:MAG: LysR family transcriptional regulator [Butyrivibrio sp.]|nr:LysR family transcriptional regulator [Butyrivibrio sp.]
MIGNLEYYKVFYYVAKLGGITAAANQLSISQPAVSQQIKQLESSLDVALFKRTSRGMSLTAEGELLYRYVARGYEQMEQGEQRLSQVLRLDAGEVRIGASDMTLRFFLLPYLEKFHELYPGIKVSVTNGPTPETIKSLEDDLIDFGIVSTADEISDHNGKNSSIHKSDSGSGEQSKAACNLKFHEVREIEDIFVAGRRFTSYKNHMLDLKDLENMPLIFLEGDTSTGKYINKFLAKNDVTIHPEFHLATSDMIVQFTLRNLGVGCVVRDFAKEYIDSGVLFELRFQQRIPHRHMCMVTDESRPKSIAARKLIELIMETKK